MNPILPDPSSLDLPQTSWSPYGRRSEALEVSPCDTGLLRGIPAPVTVLVPVTIEE